MKDSNHLMSVEEACLILQITQDEFNRIIHSDDGFPFRVLEKQILIPADGLFQWMNDHLNEKKGSCQARPKEYSYDNKYPEHIYYNVITLLSKTNGGSQ